MKLLVAGSWIGGKGIYKANISKLTFLDDLEKLPTEGFYFLLVSYQVARQTTRVWVKTSSLPPIAVLHLDGFQSVDVRENQADLIFLESSMSDPEFMKGVNLLKGLIEKGTLYQANLSNKFTFELTGKPSGLFLEFYKRQPVDYAFFFECEEFYVISGSMELFLEKKGNKLISKPIKGTSLSAQEFPFA